MWYMTNLSDNQTTSFYIIILKYHEEGKTKEANYFHSLVCILTISIEKWYFRYIYIYFYIQNGTYIETICVGMYGI